MKPGMTSSRSKNSGLSHRTQTTVVTNPPSIPATAPASVVFGYHSAQISTGPKAAPNPDQANSTNQNISGVWCNANPMPASPISTVAILPRRARAASLRRVPRTCCQ